MAAAFSLLFKTRGWGPEWLAGLPTYWGLFAHCPKDPRVYAQALCVRFWMTRASWAPPGL